MSVLAPPALFTSDTKSITPPLDDTWAYLEDPHCRPWMAMVLNLNLGDFAGAPGSLADLAYADASGEPLPHAEALGQLLGLMTTLPSELKVGKGKNPVALSPTFKETEEGRRELKTQLVLEPLRSPFEPFHIVGLRLHVLLFHIGRESFPTLTSSLWNLVIRSNEARRAREAARSRSPPINPEPAMASRYVCNVASVGKMWKSLLGDSINGTKRQGPGRKIERTPSKIGRDLLALAANVAAAEAAAEGAAEEAAAEGGTPPGTPPREQAIWTHPQESARMLQQAVARHDEKEAAALSARGGVPDVELTV